MSTSGQTKIFISDLHIGDGTKTDDFYKGEEFFRFLDIIERDNARLFIVGDLFELWQADLDRIVFHHSEVIKRLLSFADKKRLTYIIGNHDHIPFVKYIDPGLDVCLEFEDAEKAIWAEHGNQYDIFNCYKDPRMALRNRWGRSASYIMGWLERIVHPDIDEWARKSLLKKGGPFLNKAADIKNKLMPSSPGYYERGGDFSEYEDAARRLIEKGNKIVIFGHTHKPLLMKIGKGIYANCGCWCGREDPTYIRLTDERIGLLNGISHKVINSLEL